MLYIIIKSFYALEATSSLTSMMKLSKQNWLQMFYFVDSIMINLIWCDVGNSSRFTEHVQTRSLVSLMLPMLIFNAEVVNLLLLVDLISYACSFVRFFTHIRSPFNCNGTSSYICVIFRSHLINHQICLIFKLKRKIVTCG